MCSKSAPDVSSSIFYAPGEEKKSLPGHVSTVTAPPISSPVVLHLPHHPCHFELSPPGAPSPGCAAVFTQLFNKLNPHLLRGSKSRIPRLRGQVCAEHFQLMRTVSAHRSLEQAEVEKSVRPLAPGTCAK